MNDPFPSPFCLYHSTAAPANQRQIVLRPGKASCRAGKSCIICVEKAYMKMVTIAALGEKTVAESRHVSKNGNVAVSHWKPIL